MRKNNSQISDDPTVLQNTFDKAGDSFIDKLQQKGNYRDQYMSKQLSSQGQGHFQQSYLYDASSNDVNSGKVICYSHQYFSYVIKPSKCCV